jgi:hypothetical protein
MAGRRPTRMDFDTTFEAGELRKLRAWQRACPRERISAPGGARGARGGGEGSLVPGGAQGAGAVARKARAVSFAPGGAPGAGGGEEAGGGRSEFHVNE